MKLSITLLFMCALQTIAVNTMAQNAIIVLEQKSMTIAQLFEAIDNQTDYLVVYSDNEIDSRDIVEFSEQTGTVKSYLEEAFANTGIRFEFENNYIVLSRNPIISHALNNAATFKVSGVVTDEAGEPIIGANVYEKGTTNGTITDAYGEYSISVSPNAILVFSYVGYITKELEVGNSTNINAILKEDSRQLDEVVVVGYGTQKKSDITGSIASIKAGQIQDISATNAALAIQGKAAGIDIVAAGQKPGDGSTIRVRGTRSFNASNDPLYIIDGIPFNRWINDLNPSDIESIEILKDASATAIYGSRGANGVIIISTKKAKEGRSEITYDFYYGFQRPQKTYDMMDAAQFLELNREAARASNMYPLDGSNNLSDDLKILRYRDKWSDESITMGYDESGVYHADRVRTFDWGNAAIQTGNIMSHQINFTGGNEKAHVMVSAGYYSNKGIIKGQDFERFSFRVNAEYEIKKWLKIGGSTAFTPSVKNAGANSYFAGTAIPQYAIPFDDEGYMINQPVNDTYFWNIYYDFDRKNFISEQRRYRFMGSYYLDLNLGKGLRYRMNFGPDFGLLRSGDFAGVLASSRKNALNIASESTEQYMTYVLENLLYYDKTFGKHKIGITLMQSFEQERQENLSGSVADLPYEHQQFYNLGSAATITGVGSNFVMWRMLSYMGRLNYNFNEKYLLTLTGRFDGASRLAKGHKFTFFPSAAVAWRINQEDFLSGVDILDNLKLRLGYGQTGNSSVSPYGTLGGLTRTQYSTDDTSAFGYKPSVLINSDLTWEKTGQYNIGIDFSFLKGRIAGTIDAYRQNTTDLLLSRQLPTASGFSQITENVGSTRNTGIEIGLNTINVHQKDGFQWTTDLMFYSNKEEIVSLYKGKVDDVGNLWFIGHPIITHYDYKFDGIWQTAEADQMAIINSNGGTFKAGQIKLADTDGNDKINSDDRVILGSIVPKWTGSLTNTFSYKNLSLSLFLYARYGQMIRSSIERLTLDGRTNTLDVNYWTPTNPSNEYPRPDRNNQNPPYVSALSYEDGSFWKLKSATLSYILPHSITQKIMMNRCRIYITTENPFVFTKYTGLDPENGSARTGEVTTPSTKNVLIGLNITF
ncbi:MAG: TonB-dependent receptor [Tannerella sp.]|nr:TonB-dependent receptor [Tannerella sp.]